MAAAEFGAALLADFDRRIDLEAARRLRPSPFPFGARGPGAFGGGADAVVPAPARTHDLPAPSYFMLNVMAGMDPATASATAAPPPAQAAGSSIAAEEREPKAVNASSRHPANTAAAAAPDFKLASAAIFRQDRTAFAAESSTMAQKRRLLDESAGLECSYMGVGSGAGAWDAGSEETARRVATLQARLQQRLGPEYVSTRAGPSGGPKVSYIEGWKAIDLANEVFGFNGWSSSIVSIDVDYLEENPETGRVNVAVSVTVRVTLRDGTFHEDVGYGSMDNSKSRAAALEKSKKEAVTDALKRTLRTFGRVLGNCLYDKQFLRDVSKVSLPPIKFDPSKLHRRPEFAQTMAGSSSGPSVTAADRSTTTETDMAAPPISAGAPGGGNATVPPRSKTISAISHQPAPAPASAAACQSGPYAQSLAPARPIPPPNRSRTVGTGPAANTQDPDTVMSEALPVSNQGTAAVTGPTADRPTLANTTTNTQAQASANVTNANSSVSSSQKVRLAEQRKVEAQKRLARTKSLHATSGANGNPTTSANTSTAAADTSSSSSGPSAVAASPAKGVPVRLELPTFGPQIRSAKTEQQNGAGKAAAAPPTTSTPFGPRFIKPVAPPVEPEDSAIFFAGGGVASLEESDSLDRELAELEMQQQEHEERLREQEERERDKERHRAAAAAVPAERGPSVGRFTGLTPNSAQLLRSGTTSLSAAAGGGAGPLSSTPSTARKHSLCGPLQPRRPNSNVADTSSNVTADGGGNRSSISTTGVAQKTTTTTTTGGIENVGLAERMSGIGSGVGKVRGVGVGLGLSSSSGSSSGAAHGFAPASSALRSAVNPPGFGGSKRPGEGPGGGGSEADLASKRMRR
ncbi:DNA repair protein rad52 [Tilletia horrida]|nr:DNA repair protein rad52 [Tilletia horrida]